MIPKIIHYCWFGYKPIPKELQLYMKSWKEQMPGWEWKCWDESSFNVNSIPWTQNAYKSGKFAFVSDYVRLIALYEIGGIYLDTDVKLTKSLEPLANKFQAFMGFENKIQLTSAIMTFPPHHPLIKEFLEYYQYKHFSSNIVSNNEANVLMMTAICKKYGLRTDNTEQELFIPSPTANNSHVHIFPQTYFCPLDFWHNKNFTIHTHAIHYFNASWVDGNTLERIRKERSFIHKIKLTIISILAKIYHSLKQ